MLNLCCWHAQTRRQGKAWMRPFNSSSLRRSRRGCNFCRGADRLIRIYFCQALSVPVLANITEFGQTPLYTRDELRAHGVAMALCPLTAFRAMNAMAETVYQTVRERALNNHWCSACKPKQLYDYLDYYRAERELDQ